MSNIRTSAIKPHVESVGTITTAAATLVSEKLTDVRPAAVAVGLRH